MEKTLIGGLSIVNTRIGFDADLFIKNDNQKLVYKVKDKITGETKDKRIAAKILKMDENNQYRNPVTKPLPTGCIKMKNYMLNYRELQLLLESLSHRDKIGHLFIADIKFNFDSVTEKELIFNGIYTPIFGKKKVPPATERSVFQLLDAMRLNKQGILNNYKCAARTYSTMKYKYFIPLYAEHLRFLITRCGWSVTRIHAHFTFEQDTFEQEFVIQNQIARQKATTDMGNFFIS